MNNCGFSETMAKEIYNRYHEMYAVSDKWVQDKLDLAAKTGYVTVAFGLRLRTPMMKQTVMGTRVTPYEAVAEGRTAGNALGQSYCMLNSRAAMEFMQIVRRHPQYRTRVSPCAQIHDAQYYLIDDNIDLLLWVNNTLVPCVRWQQLPEIQHPTVGIGGELSVFHPSWAKEMVIPNTVDKPTLIQLAKDHLAS